MDRTEFLDLVRLELPQRRKLLAMLDNDGAEKRHGRKSSRHPCRGEMIPILVLHPGKVINAFLVLMRNLSAGGLSIIHGGYLHAGTECRVLLASIEGAKIVLSGKVRRCRHIKGNLHEIGLEFESAIVPEDFVPADMLVTTVEDLVPAEEAEAQPEGAEAAPAAEAAAESAEPQEPSSEESQSKAA